MSDQSAQLATIAVVGGTGKEGQGLATRWARAGYPIIIGSRSAGRAAEAAAALSTRLPRAQISGAPNRDAAQAASIIMLTVPYAAHTEILQDIRPALPGKLLIDATVPIRPGQASKVQLPSSGSVAQEAREIVGETVEVAGAFHTISYELLIADGPIDCDVLVTGTTSAARARTLELVRAAGLRGWDAGALENTIISEGLTSVLIHINKKYGSRHAGIRVTGANQA